MFLGVVATAPGGISKNTGSGKGSSKMEVEYRSNLFGGLVSLIFGIILIIVIPKQIAPDLIDMGTITSRTMPYIISGLFIVCGLSLLFQSIVRKQDEIKVLHLKQELFVLAFIGCLVLYAFMLKRSYLFSTIALTSATLGFQKTKNKWFYVIAIVVVIVLYFIFKELLNVRLP